jgi:tetratricopeptide (TPR) repeat protein
VASAHLYTAWVHYQRREPREALAAVEAGIEAVRDQAEYWTALQCRLIGLCARAELLREADALDALRHAIEEYEASGMRVMTTVFLGSLARGLAAQGALEAALETIDTAVSHAEELQEGYCEPDLHRTRGDVLRPRDPEAALHCYRRAFEQAREQGARAWQLRAATALVRLRGVGELGPLRALCGAFGEGADTPDVSEARALLEVGPV